MRGLWQAYDPPAKQYAVLGAKALLVRKPTTSKRDESLRVFVDLLIEHPLVNAELAASLPLVGREISKICA
jgi:hypothetical protein